MSSIQPPTPTSASIAPRCGNAVPGGHCTAPATPAAVPVRAPYDRHDWEAAVLASRLHPNAKLIALVLAHHGSDAGYLPPGGPQDATALEAVTGLRGPLVRLSLSQLQQRKFITRPDIHTWDQDEVRPVTLTMPPARTAAATRTEPAHPGEAGR